MPKDPRISTKDKIDFGTALVTLAVGPSQQCIFVHETLLCLNSAFFTSAVKEEWQGEGPRLVPLPDDIPSVVNLYVQWVYTRKICSSVPKEEDSKRGKEFDLIIDGFVFGEKIQDGRFKDALIDALIHVVSVPDEDGTCWYPTGEWVNRAFEGTPDDSPLRRLLVDFHMFRGHGEWVKDASNIEFLRDLATLHLDGRKTSSDIYPAKPELSSCSYHHHAKDQPCYRDVVLSPSELLELV